MNFRTILVLAVASGTLVGAVPGYGQPEGGAARTEKKQVAPRLAPIAPMTPPMGDVYGDPMLEPQSALLHFAEQADYGNAAYLARFVAGARPNDAVYAKLKSSYFKINLGEYRLQVEPEDIQVKVQGDTAKATVTLRAAHYLGMGIQWQEKLKLKRETSADGTKLWRLVPQELEPPQPVAGKDGVLQHLVNLLAHPQELLLRTLLQTTMVRMKAVALGAFQYMQDHDEAFALTPENFRAQVLPYLENGNIISSDKNLFTAAGDEDVEDKMGPQDFQFNGQMAGVKLDNIEAPSKTVLMYLGRDGKLDFRFGNRTVIGFADGHIEAVGRDKAQNLKWTP